MICILELDIRYSTINWGDYKRKTVFLILRLSDFIFQHFLQYVACKNWFATNGSQLKWVGKSFDISIFIVCMMHASNLHTPQTTFYREKCE